MQKERILIGVQYIHIECNTFYTWLKQENWLAFSTFSLSLSFSLFHFQENHPTEGKKQHNIITSRHIIALSRAGHVRAWNKENQFGSIFSHKLRLHTDKCERANSDNNKYFSYDYSARKSSTCSVIVNFLPFRLAISWFFLPCLNNSMA